MVFKKIKEVIEERRDPFTTRKFKGLTPEEQERALTKIATREAQLIEVKEAKEKARSEERIRKATEPGLKRLEKKAGKTGLRARLTDRDTKRTKAKAEARKVPLRKRIVGAFGAPIPSPATKAKGRSIFKKVTFVGKPQEKALEFKSMIRTAGMKPLLKRDISFTQGVTPAVAKKIESTTLGGAPQRAQAALKEQINRANLGSSPTGLRGNSPKLKAPPKLI